MTDQEAETAIEEAFKNLSARNMPLNARTVPDTATKRITEKDSQGNVIGNPSGRIYQAIEDMRNRGVLDAPDDPNDDWRLIGETDDEPSDPPQPGKSSP